MAQTIKLKRGGIGKIATTAPGSIGSGIAAGELILGTGSFNGLAGPLLLAANDANTVSPAYSRIDTIANGPALEAAIGAAGDVNLTGLIIHSGSKFYRYSGVDSTGFAELTISAGSFDGVLGVTSGGTGLDEIADNSVLVSTATDTLSAVSLATNGAILVGGTSTGPAAVAPAALGGDGITATGDDGTLVLSVDNLNDTITVAADGISVNTGSISAGGTNLVNADVINSLSASIATNISANAGSVSGGDTQVAFFDGASSVTGDAEFTYNDSTNVLTIDGSTFGQDVTIAGDLTVAGTTTTIDSTTVNIGDRIIELNTAAAAGDGGILVHENGGETGSLLWDASNNYWKSGLADDGIGGGTLYRIPEFVSTTNITEDTLIVAGGNGRLEGSGKFTEDATNGIVDAPKFTNLAGDNIDGAGVLIIEPSSNEVASVTTEGSDELAHIFGTKTDGTLAFSNVIDGGTF